MYEIKQGAFNKKTRRTDLENKLYNDIVEMYGVPPIRVAKNPTLKSYDTTSSHHVVSYNANGNSGNTTIVFIVNNFTDCVGVRKSHPDPSPPPVSISGLELVFHGTMDVNKATLISGRPFVLQD